MPEQEADPEPRHRGLPRHHNPLIKPFVVLALPGMYLFYKYNQYKRKRKENATRRLAERELQHLNYKIEKLLSKLEESEPELATCQEEECVICIHAKATMQTSPCGHQVVCRKCFVKTIQIAVSQKLLPLRCVICRAKILRLKTGPTFPSSVSGYSMTSRGSSVPTSDSLYSVSSGGSSISCSSSSSEGPSHNKEHVEGGKCCGGHCVGGAYPRQPSTGAIRRSQKQEMKITLKDYCRVERNHINRLPPIRESSPLHSVPPASTRIRCAQKIVTQLEMPLIGKARKYKYEKLPQDDDDVFEVNSMAKSTKTENQKLPEKHKKWWSDRTKSEEKIDNKKNEIMEKNMEMQEKINAKLEKKTGYKQKEIQFKDEKV
ncbi:uncharacterized protein LOC126735754 [Anthonomus grandis grandis]|uniref:uncharacterized protein LOC126735754 n=1 Tax=Anthonomus grandis grandis TaxID=2921223 RepID=UPI002164F687|nr:uncharacterized protein LOC126735754 [Anthonomus grandis grandis]